MRYKVTQKDKPKLFPSHYHMMFDPKKREIPNTLNIPPTTCSLKKKKRGKETDSPLQCDTTFDPSDRDTEQRETQIATLVQCHRHLNPSSPRTHSTPPTRLNRTPCDVTRLLVSVEFVPHCRERNSESLCMVWRSRSARDFSTDCFAISRLRHVNRPIPFETVSRKCRHSTSLHSILTNQTRQTGISRNTPLSCTISDMASLSSRNIRTMLSP